MSQILCQLIRLGSGAEDVIWLADSVASVGSCKERAGSNQILINLQTLHTTYCDEGQITSQNSVRDFCDFETT